MPHCSTLWLLQVVLLYCNDLEYSGCFIPLICMNQDTLPHLQTWKECARDHIYDCTATLQRAIKIKPFVMDPFPLLWCGSIVVSVSACFGNQHSNRAQNPKQFYSSLLYRILCWRASSTQVMLRRVNLMRVCSSVYVFIQHFAFSDLKAISNKS